MIRQLDVLQPLYIKPLIDNLGDQIEPVGVWTKEANQEMAKGVGADITKLSAHNMKRDDLRSKVTDATASLLVAAMSIYTDQKFLEDGQVYLKKLGVPMPPKLRKMIEEHQLSIDDVLNGLPRISKGDIEAVLALPQE